MRAHYLLLCSNWVEGSDELENMGKDFAKLTTLETLALEFPSYKIIKEISNLPIEANKLPMKGFRTSRKALRSSLYKNLFSILDSKFSQ